MAAVLFGGGKCRRSRNIGAYQIFAFIDGEEREGSTVEKAKTIEAADQTDSSREKRNETDHLKRNKEEDQCNHTRWP